MRVLFIGNSYTFYHDMPTELFQRIAESAGVDMTVDSVTRGGWTLEKFADSQSVFGAQIDELIEKNQYDAIVLQEQSVRPAEEHAYTAFFDAVRRLKNKITKKQGSRIILFETWSHESGSETLLKRNWTHDDMTWRLAAAYAAIAKELELEVAHVGQAFWQVCNAHPQIDLYAHDSRSHPSPAGSFLAALTLFAKISGLDPTSIHFNAQESELTATALKGAARNACVNPIPIPAKYQISSIGITCS